MAKANNVSDTPKKRGRPPKQKPGETLAERADRMIPEIKPGEKISELPEVLTPGEGEIVTAMDPAEPGADQSVENAVTVRTDSEAPLSIVGGVTTEQLKAALAVQTEQRKLIKEFIQNHLSDGTDYGKIHVVNRDKCPDADRCKKDYHYSKAVLFKPGQEKLFSLFQITDELERDEETYKMLPDIKNLVAFKCSLYRNGVKIGEGRGSAVVGDNRRDANATIKIAEKRARMDACLSLGFSEYFAQDLDDPDYKSQAEMANQRVAAQAEARDKDENGLYPRDPAQPINDQERAVLYRLTVAAGFEGQQIVEMLKLNGIADPASMTSGQARDMMSKLKNNAFAAPAKPPADPVIEDIGDEPITADDIPDLPNDPPAIEEPELVVDDDLKNEVMNRANMIGLNSRGGMWLMQRIAGKPFAKWEKLTDHEWRRAYEIVQGVLDGVIDVDDSHLGPTTKTPVEAREVPENVDPETGEVLDQADNVKNVQELFPGAEELN